MSSMNEEMKNGRNYKPLLLNGLCLLFFAWVAYRAYYDLFVFMPGVHYPRVALSENTWGDTMVQFTLNVSTTTDFILLGAALVSLYASVRVFVANFLHRGQRAKTYWIVLGVSFLVAAIAFLIQWSDFMGTAFDGVG